MEARPGERIGLAKDLPPLPDDLAGEIVFGEVFTPVAGEVIQANIAAALRRPLPMFDAQRPTLRIVAGGPSAREAPLNGPTMALNGALRLFTDKGVAPTYWAACDPQALVTGFLDGPLPRETVYLVASKCHPAVFDRLEGYDVRVWHVSDFAGPESLPIPCGASISTVSIPLGLRLGFSKQEIWGWDCCFGDDGTNHAFAQTHEYTEVIDIEVDGRTFKSTRAWLYETVNFANRAWPIYQWLGLDVRLCGDGFVKAFLAGSNAVLAPDAPFTQA